MVYRKLALSLPFLLLLGCSGDEPEVKQEQTGGNVILQGQMRALEKAKGVEQTIQDAVQQRDQEMEKQNQ
jgi:hypothetical protein